MSSVVLRIRPDDHKKKKLVISIGRAVAKKAVLRNKTKRRIRTILRPFLEKTEHSVTVIVRPGAAEKTFQELRLEIEQQIQEKR